MGSSTRLTLVLLLIFVFGTALLLDGKDGKEDAKDGAKEGVKEIVKDGDTALKMNGPGTSATTGNVLVRHDPPKVIEARDTKKGVEIRHPVKGGGAKTQKTTKPSPRGQRLVVVRDNDSWWKISAREYGSGARWEEIKRANPGIKMLKPGMKVIIPAGGRSAAVSRSRTSEPHTTRVKRHRGPQTHTVRPGESLWTISRRYYGRSSLWWVIGNQNGLGEDDALRVGRRIVIPERH